MDEEARKIRFQGMVIGSQALAKTILSEIKLAHDKSGKFTYNDYKRLEEAITNRCITILTKSAEAQGEEYVV